MKTFIVEFNNSTDRRDDECSRVKAVDQKEALKKAQESISYSRGWSIGRCVPARGGTKYERELAREFRTYCTGMIE